jgi:RNA polymerase sigma-70 factor (ECF subfamily)
MAGHVRVFENPDAVLAGAADEFARSADAALAERGRFVALVCAGPHDRALYRAIAGRAAGLRGAPIHVVVGEELCVPPDDPASRFRAMWEELARPLDLPAGHLWRFVAEFPDRGFVTDWYQEMLGRVIGRDGATDLALVGLGPDGRFGALPQPAAEADAAGSWAASVSAAADGGPAAGFTVTPAFLTRARRALFFACGAPNARALQDAVDGTNGKSPAARVASREVLWFADGPAASGLVPPPRTGPADAPAAPAAVAGLIDLAERDLVARLRRGDDRAFATVVERYGARMLATARRLLRDQEEARDVVQEAFLAAWNKRASFEGHSLLSTWLHRITVNAALMRLRRRRGGEQSIDDLLPRFGEDGHMVDPAVAWDTEADAALDRQALQARVRRAIDELPENYRIVLTLRDIEETSPQETAELLGLTVNAVHIRLHRARQALRSLLDPHFRGNVP